MASEAQILANRKNAEKSTGPRTEEGKAIVSQNAVKHGLSARQDVIASEDRDEFDRHREAMLLELRPAGPIETVLAERIVSLSWRLKRAERMQNEALDCLLAQEPAGPAAEADELGSFVQTVGPGQPDPDLALGRVVTQDFSNSRVLERLMVYERRIENSLYRTISELDRMKLLRPFDAREGHRAQGPAYRDQRFAGGQLPPDIRPVDPSTLADRPLCKTNPIPAGLRTWEPSKSISNTPLGVRGSSPRPVEVAWADTGGPPQA